MYPQELFDKLLNETSPTTSAEEPDGPLKGEFQKIPTLEEMQRIKREADELKGDFRVYADKEIDPEFYKEGKISAEDDPLVKSLVKELSDEIDREATGFLGENNIAIETVTIGGPGTRKLKAKWSLEEIAPPPRAPKFISTQEELIREFGEPEFGESELKASWAAVRKSDILMGFRGREVMETGYVYAPYKPLYVTNSWDFLNWEALFDLDSPILSRFGFLLPKQKKQYPVGLELYGWVFPLCADLSKLRREADELRAKNEKMERDLDIYARLHKQFSLDPYRGADRLFPVRELDLT
jgi:hypothetical protein